MRWLLFAVVVLLCWPLAAQEDEDPCAPFADVGHPFMVGAGDGFFEQKNYTMAVELYTCAIQADPTFAAAYINRGYAYTVQGSYDLALADFNAALELDETNIRAYNNRGVLYTRQGRFGLALTDFDLALALNPDYAVAYNNRGTVHAAEGNYDLAIADIEQAMTLDPDFAQPHAVMGMIYSALANQSYQTYRDIVGDEERRLPAGDADVVLVALDQSRETGAFSVWLPMLLPAPE
jgi:tetratricopeptide (TPR) repeat protein